MNKYAFYASAGLQKGRSFGPFQAMCRGSFLLPIKEIPEGKLMETTYDVTDLIEFALVDPNGSVLMTNCRVTSTKTSSRGIEVEIAGGES